MRLKRCDCGDEHQCELEPPVTRQVMTEVNKSGHRFEFARLTSGGRHVGDHFLRWLN